MLEVEYIDTPKGAQESGTSTSTGGQPFSSDVLKGSSNIAYATLEDGGWPLDGSRRILPDNPERIGWWSKEMSGADGTFAVPPKITIVFPVPYTATGLTFTFSPSTNQWVSRLKVTWYSKQTLLREMVAEPDSPRWLLEELVEGFDRITLEILQTPKPYQFAKIQKVMIGQSIHFGPNEIISAETVCEADHKLCELTVDTMTLEIHDRKQRKLLPQENQRVELYQNSKLVAVQYTTKSTREAPYFYRISCQSAIGLMEDTFLGGFYQAVPLDTVISAIMGDILYEISTFFDGVTITGYLPVCTRREALQQVALAIGALITTYGTDAVRLNPISDTVQGSFNGGQIFPGARLETGKRYAKVEVTRHSWVKSTEEEQLVSGEYINGTDVLLTFSEPHYGYVISGGSLSASGDNWVQVTANGSVSITAKKYDHNTMVVSRRNQYATANEQGNVLTVDAATLVTASNVDAVLNRLYDAAMLRELLEEDVVVSGQTCGVRASSLNPWGTQTRGFITSMASTYTQNGHTASIKISGIQAETEGVYCYAGELYAGDEGGLCT